MGRTWRLAMVGRTAYGCGARTYLGPQRGAVGVAGTRGAAEGSGGRWPAGYDDASVRPGSGEAHRSPVRVPRDADREAGGVRLDHHALADHQAHMTGSGHGAIRAHEEDQVTWLRLAGRDPRTPRKLVLRGARDADAGGPVGHHHQAGAVEGVPGGAAPRGRFAEVRLRG